MNEVSVIICAYSEARWDHLVAAVESVKRQTVLPTEIIIVIDHNPTLLTRVREHIPGVVTIENASAKGVSGSRNTGAFAAQGEVLAFLDDDAIADPNWIESLLQCYSDADVIGVGGKINPLWPMTRPYWFPEEFDWVVGCTYRGIPATTTSVRNMIGANMSIRRHVLIAVSGFREAFGCNHSNGNGNKTLVKARWLQHSAGDEETEFCIRIAQNFPEQMMLYTPTAHVQHCVSMQRTQLSYFLWRCYDEGIGKAALVRLHNAQIGLAAERFYVSKVLPRAILRYLGAALLRRDQTQLARGLAIIAGLTLTTTGYIVGSTYQKVKLLKEYVSWQRITSLKFTFSSHQ